jgi:stage V sporulation protein B
LLSRELCLWLYKSEEALLQLRLYSLLIPMLYCDCLTDAMVKGLGQQKVCVRYNIFTSALDVAFLYVLLPSYGMAGYYGSFLLTHLINFVLSLRRLLKISIRKIPISVPALSLTSAIFAGQAASYVPNPIFRCGGYLLILGSLLFLFRILTLEDVRWLRGLINKK